MILFLLLLVGSDYETVVVGKERELAASETHLTSKQITATPYRTAEDVLRLVPGLVLVQHGSEGKAQQYFLRGFDASHGADFAVTLEGIPLNEWSNVHAQGYLDLSLMIPETIGEVTVQKGPFTTEQGAFATAGSAEYRLQLPRSARGYSVSYTVSTTNRQRLFASISPKVGDDMLAIEAVHDDGFGQNRRIDRGAMVARKRLPHGFSLLALGQAADFQLPGLIRDDAPLGSTYNKEGRGSSARVLAAVSHLVKTGKTGPGKTGPGTVFTMSAGDHEKTVPGPVFPGPVFPAFTLRSTAWVSYRGLSVAENFTGFLYDPVNGDGRLQRQRAFSFGLRSTMDVALHPTFTLKASAGLRADVIDQREEQTDLKAQPLSVRRALAFVQTLTDAYVEAQWTPHRVFSLNAGVRLDVVALSLPPALAMASPRVNLSVQPLRALTLFAAYGRGARPPEARAFTAFTPEAEGIVDERITSGPPAITTSDAMELGARFSHRYVSVALTGFATFIARETVFDHVSALTVELNATRRLGGELVVTATPTPWLELEGALSLTDARFAQSGRPIPYAPWLVGNVRAMVSHPSGVRGGVRFLALGPRALPLGARGSTYAALDASIGYRFGIAYIDLAVENLIAQPLREGEYYFASSWTQTSSALPAIHIAAGPPLNARLTVGATY